MKGVFIVFISLVFVLESCKTYTVLNTENISAAYLTVLPYTASPFSVNEVNIHFTDENTCSQLRIHGQYIEQIVNRLQQLKEVNRAKFPIENRKYAKAWIGLQLANEKKRISIGILKNGLVKIGNRFFDKDEELLSLIFKQKIHYRILETIPKDTIWGKYLTQKQ